MFTFPTLIDDLPVGSESFELALEPIRSLLSALPSPLLFVDEAGYIVFASPSASEMFGYESRELLQQPIEVLVPLRFKSAHVFERHHFWRTPNSRPMGLGRDLLGLHKSGRELPIEIGLNPARIGDHTVCIVALVDLTERTRRADFELQKVNAALRQSNGELQRFAYLASHDLQSPLRNVNSFVELLASTYSDSLDEQGKDWIQRIVSSIGQMRTLLNDLLEYARYDLSDAPLERISLDEAAREAVQFCAEQVNALGAKVIVENLPSVLGHRSQWVRLLINLIENALKYARETPPKILIKSRFTDPMWEICVEDNGIGIAEKHYQRIFDIFTRLHGNDVYPGTGIGLAICRRIVEQHGGKIWVDSTLGQGSRFYIAIPDIP